MMKTFIALAIVLVIAQHATASVDESEFTEVSADHRFHVPRGCHSKCHPKPACHVTVYQHCNYHGYRINLKPGSYNMHQLKRMGMKNDDLSSIRVHGRCRASLYEHWNFTGKSKSWSRHDSCFTNDHMPMSMLSIKVEEEDAPTQELTEATDKWWWRRRHHHRRTWNDQTSSIKVFNHGNKRCYVDCRERDHKMRERSHKLMMRERRDKHHKREKKAKADAKKEKAVKKKEKSLKKAEKAAKARARAQERNHKKKERSHKHAARKAHEKRGKAARKAHEAAMKKAFKKNEKKIAMCAKGFDVKGHKANLYKGRCRSFARFCEMYKKFGLHDDAQMHCDNAKKAHAKMMHHHHQAAKKAKRHKHHHHHHVRHHHHHHMHVRRL